MLLKVNQTVSIIDFIKTIKIDVIRIIIFSLATGFLARGQYLSNLLIPIALVAIVGTAISLLLAFRTGQSYDRWWEARMIWGSIVNDSRSLIRELQLFLPSKCNDEIKLFAQRQIIWCYALSESLRKLPFSDRVQQYLTQHAIEDNHIPNAILSEHNKQLKRLSEDGLITEFREVQLDNTLTRFCDSMGKCERIKNTIFPDSYNKLIHLLIYIFAFILPFSLDDNYFIVKTILTAIIPLLFIVIERTAILMQDPFENAPMDTPMTTISQTIETNLLQMIDEHAPEPEVPKKQFYFIL